MAIGIVLIISALFLFAFSSPFWEGSLVLLGGILINLAIVLFIAGIVSIIDDIRKQSKANAVVNETKNLFSELANSYMFSIPDKAISEIICSDDPYLAFSKYVPCGRPTVQDFCTNLTTQFERLVDKMQVPDSNIGPLYNHVFKEISLMRETLSDDDIKTISLKQAEKLPKELTCLTDMINYESAALGIIAEYAISTSNGVLIKKVNEYRRKRGYIQ